MDDLNMNGDIDNIIREASRVYTTDAEDEKIRKFGKFEYLAKLRDSIREFADEITKKY